MKWRFFSTSLAENGSKVHGTVTADSAENCRSRKRRRREEEGVRVRVRVGVGVGVGGDFAILGGLRYP
jgi:hypothetical protein